MHELQRCFTMLFTTILPDLDYGKSDTDNDG